MKNLTQEAKLVVGSLPKHTAAATGDYVNLRNYEKAFAVITYDNTANATANNFHLYKATDVAGTDETVDQTVTNWWQNEQDDITTTDTLTKGTAGDTFAAAASKQGMIVLEVNPIDYPGYPCFAVHADAGNVANWIQVLWILYPARYAQATPPSAIV